MRQRLQAIYGDAASLRLHIGADGWTVADHPCRLLHEHHSPHPDRRRRTLAARRAASGAGALWPEAQVVAGASDGIEALRMAREQAPDIAFLDIRMPGLDGLEVARTFGSRTHVVFVTAYEEHALAAFEEGAVDYLLKPLDTARLARTIERLRARLGTPPPDLARLVQQLAPKKPPAWLQASVGSTIHFIDLGDVIYFGSELRHTRVVTDQLEAHIRTPLKELAEQLEDAGFGKSIAAL
jgi:DNA-binding LytR/AlgR family response regulator